MKDYVLRGWVFVIVLAMGFVIGKLQSLEDKINALQHSINVLPQTSHVRAGD